MERVSGTSGLCGWVYIRRERKRKLPRGDHLQTCLTNPVCTSSAVKKHVGSCGHARFVNRPGHADQLHFDLWLGPTNIALDAGSYLYNADPPWDNAFADSAHHNTVLVDRADAMIRAGRFLWLKWNQAEVLGFWRSGEGNLEVIIAERYADPESTVLHRRCVIRAGEHRWRVIDDLLGDNIHTVDLSWLMPDLPWQMSDETLQMTSPVGEVRLDVEADANTARLIRAGTCIHGDDPVESVETYGWFSPTYAYKIPALQLLNRVKKELPLRFHSKWLWTMAAPADFQVGWNAPAEKELPLKWVRFDDDFLEIDHAHSVDPSSVRRAG